MKTPKNQQLYKSVEKIIEDNRGKKDSIKEGVFVLAVYKKGKVSQAKVLMNGFKIEEIDVVLREIYGKIYEMRNRGNAKIQRINKKLGG
jgi:hypothetical protein